MTPLREDPRFNVLKTLQDGTQQIIAARTWNAIMDCVYQDTGGGTSCTDYPSLLRAWVDHGKYKANPSYTVTRISAAKARMLRAGGVLYTCREP